MANYQNNKNASELEAFFVNNYFILMLMNF